MPNKSESSTNKEKEQSTDQSISTQLSTLTRYSLTDDKKGNDGAGYPQLDRLKMEPTDSRLKYFGASTGTHLRSGQFSRPITLSMASEANVSLCKCVYLPLVVIFITVFVIVIWSIATMPPPIGTIPVELATVELTSNNEATSPIGA